MLFYWPAEEFEYHPSALAFSHGQLPHPQRRTVQYRCLRDSLQRDHRRSLCGKKATIKNSTTASSRGSLTPRNCVTCLTTSWNGVCVICLLLPLGFIIEEKHPCWEILYTALKQYESISHPVKDSWTSIHSPYWWLTWTVWARYREATKYQFKSYDLGLWVTTGLVVWLWCWAIQDFRSLEG